MDTDEAVARAMATMARERKAAEEALRSTSDDGLLAALLILTHRLHTSREVRETRLPNPALPGVTYVSAHRNETTVRQQRDLVRAEIIRRMQP